MESDRSNCMFILGRREKSQTMHAEERFKICNAPLRWLGFLVAHHREPSHLTFNSSVSLHALLQKYHTPENVHMKAI